MSKLRVRSNLGKYGCGSGFEPSPRVVALNMPDPRKATLYRDGTCRTKNFKIGPRTTALVPSRDEPSCLSIILLTLACFIVSGRVVLALSYFSPKKVAAQAQPTTSCSCWTVLFTCPCGPDYFHIVSGWALGRPTIIYRFNKAKPKCFIRSFWQNSIQIKFITKILVFRCPKLSKFFKMWPLQNKKKKKTSLKFFPNT